MYTYIAMKQLYSKSMLLLLQMLLSQGHIYSTTLKGTEQLGCICPGQTLTYECSVDGSSSTTTWTGSVFDCPEIDNELIFLHRRASEDTTISCNGGDIIGRIVGNTENNFVTQINITFSPSLNGKTIECFNHNISSGSTILVGNVSIDFTTDSILNATVDSINVSILSDSMGPLIRFSWSPAVQNCQAIGYIVNFNCGSCPNTTHDTQVICTNILIGDWECTFKVQTSCGSISGNSITQKNVVLKVPGIPQVSIIPVYRFQTRCLTKVNLMIFQGMEQLNISDAIIDPVSPIFYSIAFDSEVSNRATIPACLTGVCYHTYDIRSCHNQTISVSATNLLGSGTPYTKTIDHLNNIFEVKFNSNVTQATCHFLLWNALQNNMLNCTIVYKIHHGQEKNSELFSITGTSLTDTVVLDLSSNKLLYDVVHNFTAYATDGVFIAAILGTFIRHEEITENHFTVNGLVFGAVTGAMGLAMITAITVSIVIIIAWVLSSRKEGDTPTNGHSESAVDLRQNSGRRVFSNISTERNIAYETVFHATPES